MRIQRDTISIHSGNYNPLPENALTRVTNGLRQLRISIDLNSVRLNDIFSSLDRIISDTSRDRVHRFSVFGVGR